MHVSSGFAINISHILPDDKHCSKLHGHSWIVLVRLYGPYDQERVIDLVKPIQDMFDRSHLNFLIRNPTPRNLATHIARIIWDMLYSDEGANRLSVDIADALGYVLGAWDSRDNDDMVRFSSAVDLEWKSPDVQIIAPIMVTDDPKKYVGQYDVRIEVEESEAAKHFEAFAKCMTNAV